MRTPFFFRTYALCMLLIGLSIPYMSAAAPAVATTTAATNNKAADIQAQIDAHNNAIKQLDQEITQYQKQLDATTARKQTLQTAITQINYSIKKTTASITRTKNQIGVTQLQIEQLNRDIGDKQSSMQASKAGLAQSLRRLQQADTVPLAVALFQADNVSDAWEDIDAMQSLQGAVHENLIQLGVEKQSLSNTKSSAEDKRSQLSQQQKTLLAQQGSLSATKQSESDLLAQTKSQESAYQKLIAQKRAQQADFEAALGDLKARLNVVVRASDITPPGNGILQWPLDNVRITQYFGNTAFAASGAYNGKGHNGIDLAAPIGTPLKASLSGVVLGTGNTDVVRGCYSFGKWVMIRHGNGINTMYAHLSKISVVSGQNVSTGDVIGYSGETGYATGPHLHFGVYVSSATQIMTLGAATQAKTSCANATMPIVPLAGYLNPIAYLPTTR